MIIKAPLKNLLFLAGTLVAVLAILLFLSPQASSQSPSPQLRLHRGTFDTQEPGLFIAPQASSQPAPGPYTIIQFSGPVTPADRGALEDTGVTIVEYLPDFAYLVRGTDFQLRATEDLSKLYAQVPFTLADKFAPSLLQALQSAETNVGRLQIVAWPGQEELMAHELSSLPFDVSGEISKDQLTQIADLVSVRWIEPLGRPRILNDVARTIMGVNSVWQNASIFGSGQIIGIADSGLDTGVQNTLSPDFADRVAATYALGDGGDWTDQHGHGTHVAGSLAGSGVQSGANPAQDDYANSFAGIAPEASLVIQGFEVAADGYIDGIPADYYQLFNQVYTDGVRLHSNSWGDTTGPAGDPTEFGGYVYGTQRTDEFVWDHPDTTIFTAGGNSGRDGAPGAFGFCTGGDGVVDPDSLLSPGTAKNVVTVGASESTRDSGPYQGAIWLLMSFCFATEPIILDLIANNADGMAAFSSRGPTDDGRAKPDIIAPGINIVSNRSHDPSASALWGAYDANYAYSGGASMSTPLVAGMGTLVREWLTLRGTANPSSALVKATLLNTTHDMAPGQYGTGTTQEIPYNRPNSVSGWGRADLGFMDPPLYYALWFDDHTTGLGTGTTVTYTHTITQPLQVLTDTLPLRVMLTWTDPPASLSASSNLVNDLDLMVSGPGGVNFYGNDILTGDRTNNVEGIIINNPTTGQYQIEVSAYNVPVSTQPYALVVGGPLITPTIPVVPPVITHTAATTTEAGVSLPITATVTSASPPLTTTLYYSSTGDSSYTSLSMVNTSGDDFSAIIPAGAVLTPTLSYYIEATDTVSTVVDGPHAVTITPPPNPPVISHIPATSAEAETLLPITATVTSEGPPLTVTLYYSSTGDTSYTDLSMANASGDDFSATIPAGAVLTPTLSYYIEATDTVSTVVDGSHAVTVTALPNPPDPPAVVHSPVTSAEADTSLPITATVTSASPPLTATLYYSSTGDTSYTGLSMANASGDDFSAAIPAGAVLTPTLSYYIEATDTVSTTVDGPHAVTVTALPNPPDPPVISHNPVTLAEADTLLPITVTVTSEGPPLTVTLYYSSTGDTSYTDLSMANASGDDFSAAIPAGAVLTPTLSYYIEATDTVSTTVDGPHAVTVTAPPNPPDPPAISHSPVTSAEADISLPITATVTSEGPPLTVTLYYSSTGDASYTGLSMTNSSGDDYAATVPAGAVIAPALNYYIEARNNAGLAADGPHPVSVIAPSSDLSITKDDGLVTANAGDPVTYIISIRNNGPKDVTGATVTDVLPADLTGASWTCLATGGASCTISGSGDINETVDLPAGSELTYAISAAFDAGAVGSVSNTATVTTPVGVSDPDLGDNSATDTTLVDSVLGNSYKQVQPWSFESGDTLTYTIAVHNQSTRPRAVNLVDPIPDKATYVPGSGVASDGSLLVLVGNVLTWQGEVAPGSPVFLEFAVTTDAGQPIDAVITNTATLAEDGGEMIILQAEAIHNPGYLLTINEGGLFTTSSLVDLRYAWRTSDGVSMVQFSNDGAFPPGAETSDWLPVNGVDPSYTGWQLTTYGNYVLPRTVYARFKDDGGLTFGPIQDDIIYDPFPPEVVEVMVYTPDQAGLSGAKGLQSILNLSATVVVTTTDEHSGVGSVHLSHSAGFESYETYPVTSARTEIPWNLDPSGQVFVRAIDRAGNVSTVEVGQGLASYPVYLPLAITRP